MAWDWMSEYMHFRLRTPGTPQPETAPTDLYAETLRYDEGDEAPTTRIPHGGAELDLGMVIQATYQYHLKKRLGRGGYGSVYLADCVDSNAADPASPPPEVAIKVYNRPEGTGTAPLLKRELSSLLALRCDRIPHVYDWAINGPLAFVVMEYFPRGSLSELRPLFGKMLEPMAWQILEDVLSALNVAHRASLLHLDIKPGNILADARGGFVLTDFGISQGNLVSWNIIDPGLGTRGYQAPEQVQLREDMIDVRTDLFSLGATVWSLYSGIEISADTNLPLTHSNSPLEGFPPLSSVRADTPPALCDFIRQLTARNPADRPSCAAEALQLIQGLTGNFSVDSSAYASLPGREISDDERQIMVSSLVDPLWISVCRARGFGRFMVRFQDGQIIARQGERSYITYLLLKGKVRILRNDSMIASESREGVFLGEISTLTGTERTATMVADGMVWACAFNLPDLERLVTCNPAVGIRMIKSLAERIAGDRLRQTYGSTDRLRKIHE